MSCEACRAAGNPHCGWCSLQRRSVTQPAHSSLCSICLAFTILIYVAYYVAFHQSFPPYTAGVLRISSLDCFFSIFSCSSVLFFTSLIIYYLSREGTVIVAVCGPCVCLSVRARACVCVCMCTKYVKKLWTDFDEFCGRMECDLRKNRLDFSDEPDALSYTLPQFFTSIMYFNGIRLVAALTDGDPDCSLL